YVGDSCQPLHISYLHDGDPADSEMAWVYNRKTRKKEYESVPKASGVHTAYEANMIDYETLPIMEGIDRYLSRAARPPLVRGGKKAAQATVELMRKTFAAIPPSSLVKAYLPLKKSMTAKPAAEALWKKFGDSTIRLLGNGALLLATLWDSAWKEGRGAQKIRSAKEIPAARLASLYRKPAFLRSCTLAGIGSRLSGVSGNGNRK
ncbi:MAG TPA: hypothetical protein VG777_01905, partial [Thermoanaerobaculia bacterium]|nr:hypothetical protein [Thermoanaerobaculia bacterium]